MTFFQFIAICFLTTYGTSLIHTIINKIEKRFPGSSESSLSSMLNQGAFSCDIPMHIQIKEMALEVGVVEVAEIEELDLEFDLVDIERVKKELRRKNEKINEIVLEV